ncbi:hypothetical protein [Phormidium sp. CCY1219]|uniref:hypothetical protein n=1 Tax=Phormidium sp. CCY1219 TaxID=2886104 RepID=UPI002D1EE98D|nr:hypothetical protein [Phormidium sp. CCY1219]MEB3828358.1 hypothetical protein [Phormidium sp. CCY1219]
MTADRLRKLLRADRVSGAYKIGRNWAIPLINGKPQIRKGTRGPKPRWKGAHPVAMSYIHVNQNVIRQNNKREEKEPVISFKRGQTNQYGFEAELPEVNSIEGDAIGLFLMERMR